MKILVILSIIFLNLFAVQTNYKISTKQVNVLQTVRNIAKTIPDKNGNTYEDTLSAICLTESGAGKKTYGDIKRKKSFTKGSFGAMQIQVATARHISKRVHHLRWVDSLNDVQLAGRLMGDIKFSTKIAAHYMIYLQERRGDHFTAVSGYNGGLTNRPYYTKVMKNMQLVNHLKSTGVLT